MDGVLNYINELLILLDIRIAVIILHITYVIYYNYIYIIHMMVYCNYCDTHTHIYVYGLKKMKGITANEKREDGGKRLV